ncbi:hypothetical protein EYC79_22645 [Agrobacterium cavarae]|uniref:Lipoprotein n=1 Tax=Agrobacterium cavarae TaxID=2528239 RepID=A0ABY1Y2I7_9HYPH|nr:hypothetical protein [Agrobacterium cavarae]TBN08326.1 hypothetical protein EYC79_22645 [Agrobacterium cavarae]
MKNLLLLGLTTSILCSCVSQEQLKSERFIGLVDGRKSYRFWMYKDYQLEGWGKMLCSGGEWDEVKRERGERDLYFAQGVPIGNTRIYVTIVCK